jgi:glycerol-3-phosphate acyltransferase PlsY
LLDWLLGLAVIVIGYLLGSIPGSYIMARLTKGVDIRKVDTGNVGAASTMRAIGVWQGIVALFIDMAKGAAAILVAQALSVPLPWVLGAGFAAFLGHNYPLYLGFKGGQGVATMIGIFLVLSPFAALASLVIIGIVMLLNRHVVLHRIFFAVLIGGSLLPLFVWIFYSSTELAIYSLVLILFMIIKNWRSVKRPMKLMGNARAGKTGNLKAEVDEAKPI